MDNLLRTPSQVFRARIRSFLILYFLQGLPYGLQTRFLPIYFRLTGMSLTTVGYYKLLLVPWILKGIWAPFVDRYGDRRIWLSSSLLLLVILCILAAQFPPDYVIISAVILLLFNMTTAVQDIALDALVIDVLQPSELATGNIAQVGGYRGGTIFSGGIFAWLTGKISWASIFYILAGMYATGFYVSEFWLPYDSTRSEITIDLSGQATPGMEDTNSMPHVPNERSLGCNLRQLLEVEGTVWMVIFVIIYKIGEQGAQNLYPLFLLDNGIDPAEVGFWTGLAAQIITLIGSALGGIIIIGTMIDSLRPQLVVRAISVFIIWLTIIVWDPASTLIYVISMAALMILFLISGSVTTCAFTLTMQLSQRAPRRCRASHYSLLATGEVLGKLMIASAVGAIADYTGYAAVFGLFTLFSVIVLPFIYMAPDTVDIHT